MKKMRLLAAGLLSMTMAKTDVAEEVVHSGNVIGVMAVETDKKATIAAVPFKDFDGGDMRLANLVKTANLSEGDQLYRYDSAKGGFDGWVLNADSEGILRWEKCEKNFRLTGTGETASDNGTEADETMAVQGAGIWLVRANAPSAPFVFYLQGTASDAEPMMVAAGTTGLLGNPTSSDATPTITGMSNGDTIQFATGGALLNVYTYNSMKGQWGYWDSENKPAWVDSPTVPAGIGFWYVSKGGVVTFAW